MLSSRTTRHPGFSKRLTTLSTPQETSQIHIIGKKMIEVISELLQASSWDSRSILPCRWPALTEAGKHHWSHSTLTTTSSKISLWMSFQEISRCTTQYNLQRTNFMTLKHQSSSQNSIGTLKELQLHMEDSVPRKDAVNLLRDVHIQSKNISTGSEIALQRWVRHCHTTTTGQEAPSTL